MLHETDATHSQCNYVAMNSSLHLVLADTRAVRAYADRKVVKQAYYLWNSRQRQACRNPSPDWQNLAVIEAGLALRYVVSLIQTTEKSGITKPQKKLGRKWNKPYITH